LITLADLQPYETAGVVAAARAFRLHTTTVHRMAERLGFVFKTCTEREQYRREKERKAMAPKIRAMAAKRMTQAEMCRELGCTRFVLRRAAREARININSRALY
jgi:hypothetical protein